MLWRCVAMLDSLSGACLVVLWQYGTWSFGDFKGGEIVPGRNIPPCRAERRAQRKLSMEKETNKGRTGQTVLAENGAERRRKRRKGQKGKNVVVRSPLSGKLSCRCTPQHAPVSAGVSKPSMDVECASGCPWSTARATTPSLGQPTPE